MQFTVKFSTLGMNLVAGQVEASSVDNSKHAATDLLIRRNIKSLDSASIVDSTGKECAVLNVGAYKRARIVEWLTIRY